MKLDILALMVHPDDAELGCAGTLVLHAQEGKKTGIIDFTEGELGTNGSGKLRLEEAAEAGKIMGLSARENLGFADGFFTNDKAHQLEVIKMLRKYQPEIVIINAPTDRHPDHGRACKLSLDACFLSGLIKIETTLENKTQSAWRPKKIFSCIQNNYIEPDFVVDISTTWEQKFQAIQAYKSQFQTGKATERKSFISTPAFMNFVEARAKEYGHKIGAIYGEGFLAHQTLANRNLFDFL